MNLSMNDRKKAVLLTTALLVIAVLCVVRIYVVSHSSVETVRLSMPISIRTANYCRPSVWIR